MLATLEPKKEEARRQLEADKERTAYRILFVLGGLLCVIALLLEIFTGGPSWENKGMWSTFSLVGFGIAVVFGLILKQES